LHAAGLSIGLACLLTSGMALAVDSDGDGIDDSIDNCTLLANADQRDTDADDYGNLCDADLDNNGTVDISDFVLFSSVFGQLAPGIPAFVLADHADFDNDTIVGLSDYVTFREAFGAAPGPSCADAPAGCRPPATSINSSSQNGHIPSTSVTEQPLAGNSAYKIFGSNDLGMHCGDFDTRISSILPPFNVLHALVVLRGDDPSIVGPIDGIGVVYSAAANPGDPILTGVNSSGTGPVLSGIANDGTVFKTNFWEIVTGGSEPTSLAAYRAFYPPGILDAFAPVPDQGLPVPNVERLYLGDGGLEATQQSTPGRSGPFIDNLPQPFTAHVGNQAFFLNFPFGYISPRVNWFEAAGVPMTTFDDAGRENPWPLMRFQATDNSGTVVASTDVVLPISGEANCGACHNDDEDGGNETATQTLEAAGIPVATAFDDPKFDDSVPLVVSREYAADLNLVRLHDLKHGTHLEASTPVVCQSCHYSPALDLAQVGPKGPADPDANGRQQTNVRSMSNVMHANHGGLKDTNGNPLFPEMPPAIDANGNPRNPLVARQILMETCYQCHPGRRTDCLRGAMANADLVCQDCHGQMAQVGDDFSKFVNPANPGDFRLASDFYSNPNTLRVPWANVPTCGSCHTGDALNNLHDASDTLGAGDGIRLVQAYRIGDAKATPIVPGNRRFAENVVAFTDPGAGNPMLYRLSKGHSGVFCEACHGATHGIWPTKNPDANDNLTARQLQGHTGTIIECGTCHTADKGVTLDGPHGMHPVGVVGIEFASGGHKSLAVDSPDACRACHGKNGEGTVLSVMHKDRILACKSTTAFCPDGNSQLFPKGHQVTCSDCHDNKI